MPDGSMQTLSHHDIDRSAPAPAGSMVLFEFASAARAAAAARLFPQGYVRLDERTIGFNDEDSDLVEGIKECLAEYDLAFVERMAATGG